MKAMILAAGEGTRLRPLTLDRPKPMLPIGGKPLLEHLVRWLRRHGIADMAINLHYKPEAITDYFGDGRRFGVSITYSYEERLLGTAGAVKRLEGTFDDTFVVVYGDLLTNLDLGALIQFHVAKRRTSISNQRPLATVALYHVSNPSQCGLVELDGQGRITRFVEKPPAHAVFTDLANAGVLVLEPEVLDHIPRHEFCDFGHHLFPRLLAKGVPMYGYPISEGEYVMDIGTMEKYERAQQHGDTLLQPQE